MANQIKGKDNALAGLSACTVILGSEIFRCSSSKAQDSLINCPSPVTRTQDHTKSILSLPACIRLHSRSLIIILMPLSSHKASPLYQVKPH